MASRSNDDSSGRGRGGSSNRNQGRAGRGRGGANRNRQRDLTSVDRAFLLDLFIHLNQRAKHELVRLLTQMLGETLAPEGAPRAESSARREVVSGGVGSNRGGPTRSSKPVSTGPEGRAGGTKKSVPSRVRIWDRDILKDIPEVQEIRDLSATDRKDRPDDIRSLSICSGVVSRGLKSGANRDEIISLIRKYWKAPDELRKLYPSSDGPTDPSAPTERGLLSNSVNSDRPDAPGADTTTMGETSPPQVGLPVALAAGDQLVARLTDVSGRELIVTGPARSSDRDEESPQPPRKRQRAGGDKSWFSDCESTPGSKRESIDAPPPDDGEPDSVDGGGKPPARTTASSEAAPAGSAEPAPQVQFQLDTASTTQNIGDPTDTPRVKVPRKRKKKTSKKEGGPKGPPPGSSSGT